MTIHVLYFIRTEVKENNDTNNIKLCDVKNSVSPNILKGEAKGIFWLKNF